MKQPRLHIVAVPFPAQGHISPILHLSKILASEGFTVTFVNVDSIHKLMAKNWVPTPGLDIQLKSLSFPWNIPNGFDAYCMERLPQFFDAVPALAADLKALVEASSKEIAPVKAIISDYFLPWTQSVADELGIPRILLWSGNAAWTAIEYYVPDLIAMGKVPPTESDLLEGKAMDFIPGLSPVKPADLPVYMHVNDKRWIEITRERAPVVKAAWKVLVNSFQDLEPETFDTMKKNLGTKFMPVGPILLQKYAKHELPMNVVLRDEDESCIQWLSTQKESSVLYVSFGSIAVVDSEQFKQLAHALQSLKQPFLWVIRPELVQGGGHEELYDSFCEDTKEFGYITSWAPQLRVLEHPSVGGFLTHCGWNSMVESMSNAVPMIGWPWAAEQNFNCKLMVEDWQVAVPLFKGADGVYQQEEIERAIKSLMNDPAGKQIRMNVQNIKLKARAAVAAEGGSRTNLQDFVAELKAI